MDATLAFLDGAGGMVTRLALGIFLVVNAAFVAAVVLRRDRQLVNQWTRRLVVLDTALLLAAGGAPVASWAAKTAVRSVALVVPDAPTVQQRTEAATPAP